mmetsp:Transcript_34990/g.31534  ORF Transcript_34990/g.31534 Transcript_34990/m.31534 type:complete len:102 (+) Transcript_34990:393-698(+)
MWSIIRKTESDRMKTLYRHTYHNYYHYLKNKTEEELQEQSRAIERSQGSRVHRAKLLEISKEIQDAVKADIPSKNFEHTIETKPGRMFTIILSFLQALSDN